MHLHNAKEESLTNLLSSYLFFLYGLPKVVSSKTFADILQKIVYKKTNIDLSADNIKLTTHPNLSVILYVKKITASNDNKEKIFISDNLYVGYNLIKRTKPVISLKKIM